MARKLLLTYFSWVGLALGWGVRRFHHSVCMFSNPTEFGKSQTPCRCSGLIGWFVRFDWLVRFWCVFSVVRPQPAGVSDGAHARYPRHEEWRWLVGWLVGCCWLVCSSVGQVWLVGWLIRGLLSGRLDGLGSGGGFGVEGGGVGDGMM